MVSIGTISSVDGVPLPLTSGGGHIVVQVLLVSVDSVEGE